jgi:hypothetical protein
MQSEAFCESMLYVEVYCVTVFTCIHVQVTTELNFEVWSLLAFLFFESLPHCVHLIYTGHLVHMLFGPVHFGYDLIYMYVYICIYAYMCLSEFVIIVAML